MLLPSIRTHSLGAVLLSVLLLLLLCAAAPMSSAEESPPLTLMDEATELWMEPLAGLAQRIALLPFDSSSATRALRFVQLHREQHLASLRGGDSALKLTDWAAPIPTVRITASEARSFPPKPHAKPRIDGTVLDLDVATDDEEGADNGSDLDMRRPRPRMYSGSILHVLAMRGFDEAMGEVLSYIEPERRVAAVNAPASVIATLSLKGVTPLLLLALYAPDTNPATKHGNVVAAQKLLAAGADFNAPLAKADPHMTALALAGDRGHPFLLDYFLSLLPPTLGQPFEQYSRTPSEQTELDEWRSHLEQSRADAARGETLNEEAGADPAEWERYIKWFEGTRPKTKEEEQDERLQSSLWKSLELAVVANRLSVVRRLLSSPRDGYGLRARLNERTHAGKGDCLLHGAVVHGHVAMAKLLLEWGADPAIPSYDQLSLLQLALKYKHTKMQTFLEKYLREHRPTAIKLGGEHTEGRTSGEQTDAQAEAQQPAQEQREDQPEVANQAPEARPAASSAHDREEL